MTTRDLCAERRALSFLLRGSLVRRSAGWRFGTARVPDIVVERLVADGKAVINHSEVVLAERSRSEALIRRDLAAAEAAARRELKWAQACTEPKNIRGRRINADNHRERAGELRTALARHLRRDRPEAAAPAPGMPG